MKKMLIFLLATSLLLTLAIAANDNDTGNTQQQMTESQIQMQNELRERTQERIQAMRELNEEKIENLRERLQEREEVMLAKRNMTLKRINDEILEMKENGNTIRTRLNLSSEGNGSQLKIRLSNGRNAEIKIMPEVASQRALERLRLKNCNESQNCTIELKQIGEGNRTRAVYEARAEKEFRFLGLFRRRVNVSTQIDAETGEEIQTRKPWWSFLASEKEE